MMNHFAMQRQSFFPVNKQQAKPIANSHIGTGGKIRDAQATKTDIGWFTQSDRLFETLVFDRQS